MANEGHKTQTVHDESVADEKMTGNVTTMATGSVALAAAIANQKPQLLSKNMLQLYFIMAVGYLVSTMNGFGMLPYPKHVPPDLTHL